MVGSSVELMKPTIVLCDALLVDKISRTDTYPYVDTLVIACTTVVTKGSRP